MPDARRRFPAELVGHWMGAACIVVAWCSERELSISVSIGPDGGVDGTVGDSTLLGGRLRRNRGPIGRKMNLATDYLITAELDGCIVEKENIRRHRLYMPFNLREGVICGGVSTSGAKHNGKQSMRFSAARMQLRRAAEEGRAPAAE
ncbi:MAG: hypothetical protein JSU94_01695 [Phycisphaerales bacterium]|nr:MAG: hypothetical protein JSU94_01695 [Phycisphaerales bacterium]